MSEQGSGEPLQEQEQFSYKGKQLTLRRADDEATIDVDGRLFKVRRQAEMWRAEGVFNPYRSLHALARHIVDYIHLR